MQKQHTVQIIKIRPQEKLHLRNATHIHILTMFGFCLVGWVFCLEKVFQNSEHLLFLLLFPSLSLSLPISSLIPSAATCTRKPAALCHASSHPAPPHRRCWKLGDASNQFFPVPLKMPRSHMSWSLPNITINIWVTSVP